MFFQNKKETKNLIESDFGKTLEEIVKTFPEMYIAIKNTQYILVLIQEKPFKCKNVYAS